MYWTQGLHRAVQQHPEAPATVFGGRIRSFGDQADRVPRLAAALRTLGVRTGERVAVLAFNSDRFAELLLAVPWADGVLVPLSVRWGPAEIGFALADSGARVLVVDDAFVPLAAGLTARCPDVGAVVHANEGEPPDGMLGYEDLLAAAEPVADVRRGDDELAALMYTGGTTGTARA